MADDPMDHESAGKMSMVPPTQASVDAEDGAGDEGGWTLESVNIRPAKNGGFIVQCSRTRERAEENAPGGQGGVSPVKNYESNDYAFRSTDELFAFLQDEIGEAEPAPAQNPPPNAAIAPGPSAPPAGAGMTY